jgi:hypothetical protein
MSSNWSNLRRQLAAGADLYNDIRDLMNDAADASRIVNVTAPPMLQLYTSVAGRLRPLVDTISQADLAPILRLLLPPRQIAFLNCGLPWI